MAFGVQLVVLKVQGRGVAARYAKRGWVPEPMPNRLGLTAKAKCWNQGSIVAEQSYRPKIDRNLRTVTGKTFLNGLASSMMRAVMQPFVLSLGAPMSTLGFLESLGGMHGLLTSVLQYYSGWLSDRLGRKPFLILANACGVLGIGLLCRCRPYGKLAVAGARLCASLGYVDGRSGRPVDGRRVLADQRPGCGLQPADDGLCCARDLCPGPGRLAGRAVGIRAGLCPGGAALRGWACCWSCAFCARRFHRAGERITWSELKAATRQLVVPPRGLRGYYWTMAVDSFSWGLALSLLFGMLTQTYGFTTFQLGIMSSLMALTWTLSQWPVGKLIDRFGSKPMMLVSQVGGIPHRSGPCLCFYVPRLCRDLCLLSASWPRPGCRLR